MYLNTQVQELSMLDYSSPISRAVPTALSRLPKIVCTSHAIGYITENVLYQTILTHYLSLLKST